MAWQEKIVITKQLCLIIVHSCSFCKFPTVIKLRGLRKRRRSLELWRKSGSGSHPQWRLLPSLPDFSFGKAFPIECLSEPYSKWIFTLLYTNDYQGNLIFVEHLKPVRASHSKTWVSTYNKVIDKEYEKNFNAVTVFFFSCFQNCERLAWPRSSEFVEIYK